MTVFVLMVSVASSNRLRTQKILIASTPQPIHVKLDSINKKVVELEVLVEKNFK